MGQDMGSALPPSTPLSCIPYFLAMAIPTFLFAMTEPLVTAFSVTHLQSSVAHDYPNESVVSNIKVITIIYIKLQSKGPHYTEESTDG